MKYLFIILTNYSTIKMKSRFLPLLFICLQLLILSSINAQSFKGQWHGESNGEVGTMSFDKKGYVAFIINGETVGGKEYIAEGVKLSMRYEYDEAPQPHTLDFIILMGEEELVRMLGIYQFRDKNTLIVNMDFEGKERPLAFDEDDKNQVTLTRVK